jgi:hypothetical protein
MLYEELDRIKLPEDRKRYIKDNMMKALNQRELPHRQRLIIALRGFWHSTFEISVAPAALSFAVIIGLLTLAVYPGFSPAGKHINNEIVYLQSTVEQNGMQTVVYLPVEMETEKQ